MKKYLVTMRVEIERYVDANSESEALSIVDKVDMMHELKNYKVDADFNVEEA